MPDVVGMNLQGAQDKIQSLGVFFPVARTRAVPAVHKF